MDQTKPMQSAELDRYSFYWSEARLLIAAVALFLGGVPPILAFNPIWALYGTLRILLTLAWIISGAVSVYLVYRWSTNQQKIFGGKDQLDTIAFFVNVVSGLNLGFAGLFGRNIGMGISSNYAIFILVGVIYVVSAYHLWQRWTANKQKLF